MQRFVVGLLTGLVLVGSLTALAQTDDVAVPRAELEAMRDRIDGWLASSPPASSSTTSSSSTSSSTTSTIPPTSTSSTTSTTVARPQPSGEAYDILVNDETVEDQAIRLWRAPYFRSLPFTSGVGWVDGDRCAYRSAYGHLVRDGQLVARFTFVRVREAPYIVINDELMREGQRYWDGEPGSPAPGETGLHDCPVDASQPYEPSDVDERPTVYFRGTDGALLEIRDYKQTDAHASVTFELAEVISEPFEIVSPAGRPHTVYSRVTVVARENGLPVVAVYYDSLDPSVVMEAEL